MEDKERDREKRETPITDGDARPDSPANPQNKKAGQPALGEDADKKFESERSSDLNSLEDYKDAK